MNGQTNPSSGSVDVPALPRALTQALPVVIAGTVLFSVSLIITFLMRNMFGEAWIVSACGVGVGAAGAAVLTAQLRAARRGDRGAQRGLV
ncbi:hypothetical protein GCM10027289_19830 [Tsukamurella serpentis]